MHSESKLGEIRKYSGKLQVFLWKLPHHGDGLRSQPLPAHREESAMKKPFTFSALFALVLALVLTAGNAWAGFINPITQQITYQGSLSEAGQPYEGSVPMVFRLYPQLEGGSPGGPVISENVSVVGGLFQVDLNFGNIFGTEAKWLEIEVDGQVLTPRQPIRAAPLALHALSANFPGWRLTGNANTNAEVHYLGTTNAQPLVVRVDGKRALRIEPRPGTETPSIVGGHESNSLGPLADGSFIGGGGTGAFPNLAGGPRNVIGGGSGNATRLFASVVAGGFRNCAGGRYSFAAGHRAKVRANTEPAAADDPCALLGSLGGEHGDQGTFVWADSTNANFVSSGENQFLVRAGGGMGVGTNAPQSQLHVRTEVDAPGVEFGFNPTLLVENENPADFFTQAIFARATGDLGVGLMAESTHPTGSTLGIQTSVASASGRAIQATSPAGGYAAYFEGGRVFSQGNIGIGVANPTFLLHLNQDSAFKPGSNTWTTSSDERLKTDIETLDGSLDKLLALRGVSYRWRDPASQGGHEGIHAGLLAQNVEQVFPEWVGTDPQGFTTVTVTGFEGLVAEALRELRGEKDQAIARLEAENEALRARQDREIAELRTELALLRELVAPAVAAGGQ
jgi:hypothetical protein